MIDFNKSPTTDFYTFVVCRFCIVTGSFKA